MGANRNVSKRKRKKKDVAVNYQVVDIGSFIRSLGLCYLPQACEEVRQERIDLETERMRVVQAARESRRPITRKLKPQHWSSPASSENAPKKAAKVK